jgi:hypothetical protein
LNNGNDVAVADIGSGGEGRENASGIAGKVASGGDAKADIPRKLLIESVDDAGHGWFKYIIFLGRSAAATPNGKVRSAVGSVPELVGVFALASR